MKKDIKKYEVLENNAGGLTLVVFGKNGLVEYIHSGYEYVPGSLKRDIQSLEDGDDPAVEWEGNAENPQAEYEEIVSFENGFEVVADNDGIYPDRMGAAASSEFGCNKDED